MDTEQLSRNYQAVLEQIEQAAQRAGRNPAEILLLPVSKGQDPSVIDALARLGPTTFGENRIQEAKAKIPLCSGRLRWHMIGYLQSNKVRDAVRMFQMIHSVDSLALAAEISKWADKMATRVPILLEVNVAGESSKFGLSPQAVLDSISEFNQIPKVEVQGLMTIAPWSKEPEKVRPIFRKLKDLQRQCQEKLGGELPHLSMGMSGDYPVAIEEGATIIRVGTALFGPRKTMVKPKTSAEEE